MVWRLQNMAIEVNGRPASVFAIRQPNGTAGIVTDAGRPFHVRVENQISEPSLIHWHGLTPPQQIFDELIHGKRFPGAVRDTVMVTPGRRVVVAFDANNPGWWAFHCHLLYHLDAGMFTTFRYV